LQHGSAEGRVWSCQSKHLPPGKGSKQECYDTFSSFIKMATPHMGAWQVSGAKDFQINPPSCNALVFAEGRDHAWMTFSLKTHRRYLGPYWMFYLIGPKLVTDIWREVYLGPMITIVTIPEHLGNLSNYPDDYNKLLLVDRCVLRSYTTCTFRLRLYRTIIYTKYVSRALPRRYAAVGGVWAR
jgi:hypothetical protein